MGRDSYEKIAPLPISLMNREGNVLLMHLEGVLDSSVYINEHWHDWIEILRIKKGKSTIYTNQGKFEVQEGESILIGSRISHAIKTDIGAHYTQCFHIHASYFQQLDLLEELSQGCLILDNCLIDEALDNISRNLGRPDLINDLLVRENLYSLVIQIIKDNNFNKRITDQNNKEIIVQQICNYVDINYGNNLSLSNVSRKFNYTVQYISTMFKEELNINYLEYVNQVRITKAKELLLTTRKPLIEISLDCGYNSEHTLIRNFKKYVGMTPNAYRKLV